MLIPGGNRNGRMYFSGPEFWSYFVAGPCSWSDTSIILLKGLFSFIYFTVDLVLDFLLVLDGAFYVFLLPMIFPFRKTMTFFIWLVSMPFCTLCVCGLSNCLVLMCCVSARKRYHCEYTIMNHFSYLIFWWKKLLAKCWCLCFPMILNCHLF
jgi:hypothetical protein